MDLVGACSLAASAAAVFGKAENTSPFSLSLALAVSVVSRNDLWSDIFAAIKNCTNTVTCCDRTYIHSSHIARFKLRADDRQTRRSRQSIRMEADVDSGDHYGWNVTCNIRPVALWFLFFLCVWLVVFPLRCYSFRGGCNGPYEHDKSFSPVCVFINIIKRERFSSTFHCWFYDVSSFMRSIWSSEIITLDKLSDAI